MRKHCTFWLLVATGGLLLPATLTAEDDSAEGVVRLGSGRPVAAQPAASEDGAQQAGFHWGGSGCGNGDCEYGACGNGACGYGYGPPCGFGGDYGCPSGCNNGICGGYGCDPCGNGNCNSCGLINHLRCHAVGGCHHSPDHGWAPPGKHPRPRNAATYRRWFPASWTGEGPAGEGGYCYPMVYTPTDTTQLGYYHQRVPVWQPRAGMIPPVPHPDTFHVPNYGNCGHGTCGYGAGGYGAPCGYEGEIVGGYGNDGGYTVDESYSSDSGSSGVPVESAPVEAPPAPLEDGGSAEPYVPGPSQSSPVPPAPGPAPEAPPAGGTNASGLEKSALAPYLYATPQR